MKNNPAGEHRSRYENIVAASTIIAAVTLLFTPLDNDYRARWYGASMDWMHLPLFAVVCLAACKMLRSRRPLAIAMVACLATLTELFQPMFGRSGSFADWINGMLGICCAACWIYFTQRRVIRWWGVLAFAAWPTIVAFPIWWDAFQEWREFPVLSEFRTQIEIRRWHVNNASIQIEAPGSAKFSFRPSRTSAAVLLPAVRDWSKCRQLVCDFEFEGAPLTILLSIRDGKKLPPSVPRFDLWCRYAAGKHHVIVELDDLRRGGKFPPIDLNNVQSFHVVALDDKPREIRVKSVHLIGK